MDKINSEAILYEIEKKRCYTVKITNYLFLFSLLKIGIFLNFSIPLDFVHLII
jgi:hypothetical protein